MLAVALTDAAIVVTSGEGTERDLAPSSGCLHRLDHAAHQQPIAADAPRQAAQPVEIRWRSELLEHLRVIGKQTDVEPVTATSNPACNIRAAGRASGRLAQRIRRDCAELPSAVDPRPELDPGLAVKQRDIRRRRPAQPHPRPAQASPTA